MGALYLIRHGEVQSNRDNKYIGSTDLPLNQNGLRQADRLAQYLAGCGISSVYTSSLLRAVQTAESFASSLNLPIYTVDEFRELNYGEWEGIAEAKVPILYPNEFNSWRADPVNVKVPGGESIADLRDRAIPAFHRTSDSHPEESVAIVGHKTVNRVLLCHLLEIDLGIYRQIGQGNAAVNLIRRRKDGTFVVESINDCSYKSDNH